MGKNYKFDDGKSIEETIKSALSDGDLSELKNLGPVVQKAFRSFLFGSQSRNDIPYSTPQNTTQTGKNPSAEPAAPASYPPTAPASYPPAQTNPVQASPSYYVSHSPRRIKRRLSRGLPQIISGALIDSIFVPVTLVSLIALLTGMQTTFFLAGVILTIGCGAITLAGACLLVVGIRKYGLSKRATQLVNLLQNNEVHTLDDLAAKTNRCPRQIKHDLRKIREKGVFPQIYTNTDETCVMWGQDTYEKYLLSEETRQKKLHEEEDRRRRLENPATADIEYFRSEGESFILKIRAANDVIAGEEISAKLDVLEDTTTRIFTYVERYPEKLPSTRKFVNHYLPTTLKLVEKYHQYDRMDFEPQNVRQTKAEIERSLDTISIAFNNLLESLFVHDTLDVTTDIKVLENMLEQEGLIGNTFKIDQPGPTQNLS